MECYTSARIYTVRVNEKTLNKEVSQYPKAPAHVIAINTLETGRVRSVFL
jgi:hypothetical protein